MRRRHRTSRVYLFAIGVVLLGGATAWAGERPNLGYRDVCPVEADGHRKCDVKIRTDANGKIAFDSSSPNGGYAPADLQSAYALDPAAGAGKIVALFGGDADYTNGESDLAVYRSQYGLPPCTSANGCFIKIDENGGTDYPPAGTDETEQSLDIEMASAACPACKIMLIEGGDMNVALATAIARGVSAFSFSVLFGFNGATASECQSLGFNDTMTSGILVSGALGDTAYPGARDYIPATCQGALAVGGTTLNRATNARGWTETTWSKTGSGCSPYVAKPPWQTDTGCGMRMEADVAAVADPGTGVSVYNTQGQSGWGVFGGTSAASPLVAASLTSLGIANGHFTPAWVWQNSQNFFDVTTGDNGDCGDAGVPSYFCTAGTGYDGPTGWGTLNGNLLRSALPPGLDAGVSGACPMPTGSYSKTCTDCVSGVRDIGCALACESCTKIDGTQNPGPVLALPCSADIENADGVLHCDGVEVADAGTGAGASQIDAGGTSTGGIDASIPPPIFDSGAAVAVEAGEFVLDGGEGNGESTGAPSSASSAGCGCTNARTGESHLPVALGGTIALAFGARRRRARRGHRETKRVDVGDHDQ